MSVALFSSLDPFPTSDTLHQCIWSVSTSSVFFCYIDDSHVQLGLKTVAKSYSKNGLSFIFCKFTFHSIHEASM